MPTADPDACWIEIWTQLRHAVADRDSPMRTPVLASIDLDGSPRVRTVVLREVDRAVYGVVFHTDVRSPKINQLGRDPRVELCFYDPTSRVQIRLRGRASINDASSAVNQAIGQSLPELNRNAYRGAAAPSSVDRRGDVGPLATDGRAHFAAVSVVVSHVDWLWLAPGGHQRLSFARADGPWRCDVLVP